MAHATLNTDSLIVRLNSGNTSSAELEQATGRSQSWVSTALRSLITQRRVVRMGSRRGARYALRRDITPIGSAWPLYRVGRNGEPIEVGTLYALAADEFYLEATKAAGAGFAIASLSAGIPYLLQDQRPGGFLGSAIPQLFPQLHAPPRIQDWTDEHYLRYLTTYGSDVVGDLILGRPALDDYLLQMRQLVPRDAGQRNKYFPELADQSMHGGVPGSSAQGEHPKFAVTLAEQGEVRHTLVKFSPPVETEVGRRWSDLLVAEHLALETLATAGISSAKSRVFQFENRTYLEVDRFDRVGVAGRVGVTSLLAIDTGFYGALDNWIAAAQRLHQERRIDIQTLDEIRLISSFADLIANTDKHFGNLAFYDDYDGRFRLTPAYDMLPMLFAPAHDQLVTRIYTPTDPTSDTLNVWGRARSLAEEYWRSLESEPRISAEFRTICAACLQTLQALPRTGAYSPRIAAGERAAGE
ncbi:MAG: type II toxin-antitoxin system HipA family toxin YjjJ [Steroidobacteraceae bacterium]